MKESLLCRVLVFFAETPKSAIRIEKGILLDNNNNSQQSFEDDNREFKKVPLKPTGRDRFHDVLATGMAGDTLLTQNEVFHTWSSAYRAAAFTFAHYSTPFSAR